jgi:hypothetical protein
METRLIVLPTIATTLDDRILYPTGDAGNPGNRGNAAVIDPGRTGVMLVILVTEVMLL